VREALSAHLLKLSFLLIELLVEGDATAPLLLQIDLGAGLPLWRLRFGRLEESRLAGPQPLLSALYTILADFLSGNLRKQGLQVELYTEAIVLMRRLLHLQRRSGQTLPLMRWPMLWEALFSTAAFVSTDEMSAVAGVAELGLEMLQLINTLAVLGPDAFPNAATFESFSYELVRGHRVTEQLYATGRKQAAQRVADLKLSRSLVALAVDALPQVEGAAGKMSAPEAATAVHKLQLQVAADSLALVSRPPPPHSPHEQALFRQQCLRAMLARARTDGSAAPLTFEDLCKGTLS